MSISWFDRYIYIFFILSKIIFVLTSQTCILRSWKGKDTKAFCPWNRAPLAGNGKLLLEHCKGNGQGHQRQSPPWSILFLEILKRFEFQSNWNVFLRRERFSIHDLKTEVHADLLSTHSHHSMISFRLVFRQTLSRLYFKCLPSNTRTVYIQINNHFTTKFNSEVHSE